MGNEICAKLKQFFGDRPYVRRSDLAATGLIAEKTLSNADSRGCGIEGKTMINGRISYPTENACRWLAEKRP